MFSKRIWLAVSLLLIFALSLSACAKATPVATEAPVVPTEAPVVTEAPVATEAPKELTFGLLMVGPYNDHGWSEAHYNAGLYVEENLPGAKMVYIDKVNTADRPGTTPDQLAEELVAQGATVVIFNSDDMKDAATTFAQAHPDVNVIMASGDQQWAEGKDYKNLANMVNVMGRMEYGKMIAGCAAALTTKSGKIGYLGPLINDETRRLAASVYLGAKYCWTNYLQKPAADLKFKVTWIGFWFNIPGFTSDPTVVADDFLNSGYDVVVSGIDTTEAIIQAKAKRAAGVDAWAIPYDFEGACAEAPEVCLGVPYFNWGPSYLTYLTAAMNGEFKPAFDWFGPDWTDLNNKDTSMIGFEKGAALTPEAATSLDAFIAELAGGLNLWTGPLNLQDGTPFLADAEVGTDFQVWYLPQLLEGMEGQSVAE